MASRIGQNIEFVGMEKQSIFLSMNGLNSVGKSFNLNKLLDF
jgi:hypothetical protein